jgi:hypothetical protein
VRDAVFERILDLGLLRHSSSIRGLSGQLDSVFVCALAPFRLEALFVATVLGAPNLMGEVLCGSGTV